MPKGGPTGVIKDDEFQAALLEYAMKRTNRDLPYICNRVALNVAFKGAAITPVALRSKIEALAHREWWPAFVAKTIAHRKDYSKGIRGVRVGRRRIKAGTAKGNRYYTRAQARVISRALIKARVRKVTYLKSSWRPIIDKLKKLKLGLWTPGALKGVKRFKRKPSEVVAAAPGPRVATLLYWNKTQGRLIEPTLAQALRDAAKDMRQFIAGQYRKTAKEHVPKVR